MATASTFSYAQAAKGQGSPATTPMQETNGQSPDSKDALATQESSDNGAVRNETTEENFRPAESGETVPPQEIESRDSATSRLGSRREDDDATTEGSARRSDKSAARSPSVSTRVTDDNESKKGQRKGRKGKNGDSEKKGKDAEKEKEKEQPKIELIEATIPSVNIWAQRKEAQAAKAPAKPNASAPSAPRPDASAAGQDAEPKKKTKASEPVAPMSVQHSSAHGAKNQKKGETDGDASTRRSAPRGSRVGAGLPSVGDASSWPTPETATKEEKPKTAEKTDKFEKTETQEDANASKSRRREWERIDFVPTVNWETHIPAPRGTRGGRSGPGSRAGRDVPTRGGHSTAPASVVDKPADATPAPAKNAGTEPREKRDGASNRGNSVAPAVSKAPVADAPRSEQRKTSAPTKGSKTREGVPSSEPSGPRGEGRGERGRGGFRGRGGGHAAGNSGHGQNFMANGTGFAPSSGPRGGHFMSPPLGQGNSFQGHGAPQGRGGRGNRGQSAGYRASGPNGSARPRPLSTVSNFAPYQWDPNYAGMPMTAPPYPPHHHHQQQQQQQSFNFELKAILTQQVEFYFSLENLCKDQFLRSHMDGQGFVPLSVIRGFHRVSKLCSDNHNLLRAACADMTQVDFVVSNDGVERLRSRQHWPMFILPVEQRETAARNNGPESVMFFNHDSQQMNGMMGGAYGVGPVPYMNGNGVDESIPYMNGSHHADGNGQLSATVPEFQPSSLNSPVNEQEDQGKTTADAPNGSVDSSETVKQLANGVHSDFQPSQTLQS